MGLSGLKKAESYIQSGKLDRAEKELRKFLGKNKAVIEAWLMLASVYGQTGRFKEVAAAAKKAISINSNQATAYSLLGSASVYLGNLDEAIESLETANRLSPRNAGVLNNLGNAYYAAEKFDDAERCYQQVLDININYPQSNFGMAKCRLAQSSWSEAIQYFRKAYSAMSDNYDINISLGKAHLNLGHLGEAYDCIERATRLTDSPGIAYYELAHIAQLGGELEKAIELIDTSLKHDASNTRALAERAEINYKLGRHEQAHVEIKSLILDNIVTPPVVITWGNLCQKFDECKEVINQAELLLKANNISKSDQTSLHYMLGALYDKQGNYDKAFEHYQNANSALPGNYDRDEFVKTVDMLIDDFSAESIEQMPGSGFDDERPVFIVGMPRSGTSLVEQILSSHPEVYGAGELNEINRFARILSITSHQQNIKVFSNTKTSKLAELAGQYLNRLEEKCGDAVRVTDKMPANFLWLGFIMQLFPKARIIHCNRDPRDTCLSIYFQQFIGSHDYANNLDDVAFYYRQYERIMSHWQSCVKLPVLNVYYKELVADVETITRQMIKYLELPWDDRCLAYHESKRTAATASWDQVRQPIYTKSLGRWRRYQKHLGSLIDDFGSNDAADCMKPENNCKQA